MKKGNILLILAFTLVLTGCGGFPFSNGGAGNGNYYTGTEGVMATYEKTSPPAKMYYYTDTPDENVFDIFVRVHNKGSSYTKGGVYISGYDPSKIKIKGVDIDRTAGAFSDCDVDFGLNSNILAGGSWSDYFGEGGNFWKGVSGSFDCVSGMRGEYQDDTHWSAGVDDLGDLLGEYFGDDVSWLDGIGFDIVRGNNGIESIGLKLGDDFDVQYMNHGIGMLILMAGMSFNWNGGQEYILRPDSLEYPGGEQTIHNFETAITAWPQNTEYMEAPFLLTNCYLYTTFYNRMVCIDPAPYETERTKVCTPRPIITSNGQGAPVAVTKVNPIGSKTKVIFEITVNNVGKGTVFDMGNMNKCGPYSPLGRLTSKDIDRVYLLDARIGEQQLDCKNSRDQPIVLINGEKTFTCTYYTEYQSVKSGYETPLILEIGYGYQQSEMKRTQITRI